jgi:hypothetical protein
MNNSVELKHKSRDNFYSKEFNYDRLNEVLNIVISQLNFKECSKMFGEIMNDQIAYHGEDSKGRIYNGNYTQRQIELATNIYRRERDMRDLFNQIIIDKNDFNDEYLKRFNLSNELVFENQRLKKKIEELEKEIHNLRKTFIGFE